MQNLDNLSEKELQSFILLLNKKINDKKAILSELDKNNNKNSQEKFEEYKLKTRIELLENQLQLCLDKLDQDNKRSK